MKSVLQLPRVPQEGHDLEHDVMRGSSRASYNKIQCDAMDEVSVEEIVAEDVVAVRECEEVYVSFVSTISAYMTLKLIAMLLPQSKQHPVPTEEPILCESTTVMPPTRDH